MSWLFFLFKFLRDLLFAELVEAKLLENCVGHSCIYGMGIIGKKTCKYLCLQSLHFSSTYLVGSQWMDSVVLNFVVFDTPEIVFPARK